MKGSEESHSSLVIRVLLFEQTSLQNARARRNRIAIGKAFRVWGFGERENKAIAELCERREMSCY